MAPGPATRSPSGVTGSHWVVHSPVQALLSPFWVSLRKMYTARPSPLTRMGPYDSERLARITVSSPPVTGTPVASVAAACVGVAVVAGDSVATGDSLATGDAVAAGDSV